MCTENIFIEISLSMDGHENLLMFAFFPNSRGVDESMTSKKIYAKINGNSFSIALCGAYKQRNFFRSTFTIF